MSFRSAGWSWDEKFVRPLSDALVRKADPINKANVKLEPEHFVSVRFGGVIEARDLDGKPDYKGNLFWAKAGDVIYSKIDCRNGAIGIVPKAFPRVAVSTEFPVYSVRSDRADGDYICLVFQTQHFLQFINGMVSGASGRKRVQPEELEKVEIPLPSLPSQRAIVAHWRKAQDAVTQAQEEVLAGSRELNNALHALTDFRTAGNPWLALHRRDMEQWDAKSARAAAFRLANPAFKPFAAYAEESTVMVKPWLEPDKEWPVYGVNNKEGVVFSHRQKGSEFNAPYKRIRRDWFFHNPTRSSVGSLGIVPDVPEDAITSPEYQVWRLRPGGWETQFVAAFIRTEWFVKLIQFHRVGAVKQRLHVENLLAIPVPDMPKKLREKVAVKREAALRKLAEARARAGIVKSEVEQMILGVKPIEA